MTSPAHSLPASTLSWESFALTDSRWLVHAMLWTLAVQAAVMVLPWLFTGYPVIFGLALLAAVATAYTDKRELSALPPATLIRYILVDGTFVTLAAQPVNVLVHILFVATGLVMSASGTYYGHVLSLAFVGSFYLFLGLIGHARQGPSGLRTIPPAAAATAVLLLITFVPNYGAYKAVQQAREAGVAAYERETGRTTTELDRLSIGNSLHGFDNRVTTITVDPHGRLLVSGDFEYYAGKDARGLVRLLPDGQKDAAFSVRQMGDPAIFAPSRILVSPDGSIMVNTPLTASEGVSKGLTRLEPDGAVDPQFRLDMSLDGTDREPFEAMDIQPDGRLVIVPPIRFLQKPGDVCLVRLDRAGVRDTAFSTAAMDALFGPASARTQEPVCAVSRVVALSTGHLLVVGGFPAAGGRQGLVRLNPDGTLDASYRAELEGMEFSRSAVAPSGEVIVVSHEAIPGSSPVAYQARILKLTADGRRDPSFAVPPGRFRRIELVAVQPDGKIVVTGSLKEKDYGAIVRLLPDGRPDPAFAPPTGVMRVNGFIAAIAVQPDGRIVLGGEFLEVIGPSTGQRTDRFHIARLLPDGSLDTSFNPR